ncbi:protein of unknown function, might be Group II intron reverse transcriptase/maturase [Moritella yayanosii]|uniref:Uncharacterized protein n=1 Tax=Moritella yayanosii TaxID=69539 RepID=A0A330LR69_9GAMM|nr:protein of unknown function, might be Group II intron reverse transcriptase/maturase [Moritella yayanosii]
MPNQWFKSIGLYSIKEVKTGVHAFLLRHSKLQEPYTRSVRTVL